MSAASVIRACDLLPTDSGSYTTPGTGRNTPPPGNISANVGQRLPSQVSDFNKPSPSTSKASTGTDSGYASFVSTPEKLAQKLFKRTPKRLSIFEKDLPDLVNNRFYDLYVLFNEPLYRYLGRHGVTATAISIKLMYAGESEATAKPWIIVQCDERASKRVRRFFNQQQIKAQYQPRDAGSPDVDFGLLVHGTPPKQMATKSEHYICGDTWDGAPTLCGKVIKICTSNETRLATLGGLIKVVRSEGIQLYGMTAGHIVTRKEFDQDVVDDGDDTNEKQSMKDLSFTVNNASVAGSTEDGPTDEASVTDDQSCSGDKDGDDHDESSEQGEDEEEYELDLGSVNNQQGKSIINPTAVSQCLQRSSVLQYHWPKLGHLSFVSHQPGSNNDLDWALIQFQDPTLYRPNLLVFPENTYEFGVSAGLREGPRRLTRATRSRDVLLLSGMAGLKRGKLATSFGYLMIGPVKQFNEIYNVSMSDGSVLDAGDCGSWVVDSVTHEVYGHVVASDAFGDAYVIPLDNTFRDIKQQLAADQVCLPTESEVLEWIEPRKNPSILSWCADQTLPDLPRDLRLDFEHEMASSTPESELLDKQLKDTDAGLSKSYGSIDDHEAPLCDPFYFYCASSCGDTPASCAMSTSISNSPSVADSRLLGAFPDSGYSSMHSTPQRYSEASSAISSTAAAKGTNSQKYSSALSPSSSSAASSSPDYPCLHPFCDHRSKRPSDLDRHITKHFPPPSSKTFDCPSLGCGRIGDFGFSKKGELNAHIRKDHDKDVSKKERAARLSRKRRASPAEEDLPRARTKCFRGVMAPAISEVGHSVSQGMNLTLIQRPPREVARDNAGKADIVAFQMVWPNITQSLFFEQNEKGSDPEIDSGYGSRSSME